MPRKYEPFHKLQRYDPKYRSKLVGKFINKLMWDGKRSTAASLFYRALDYVKQKANVEDPIEVFMKAIENAQPQLITKKRRVGGANYQVPSPVEPHKAVSLAMSWIIESVRGKRVRGKSGPKPGRKPTYVSLGDEIIAASKGEGGACRKKEEVHRNAEGNRAFAHLAF